MAYILNASGVYAFVCANTSLIYDYNTDEESYIEYPEIPKPSKEENLEENVTPTEASEDSKIPIKTPKNSVLCTSLSKCGKYLAISDEEKRLIIWEYKSSWKLLSNRTIVRKFIKLKFTHSAKHVLAADRGGDVYQFAVYEPDSSGELILGHLSMLLDIIITPDDKYVITCDRDEKIRVSNYPNCYNIHSYCLGHTEFVTSLALCGPNLQYLLSGSGDSTIRVWDYIEGEELSLVSFTDLGVSLSTDVERVPAVKSISSNETLVAALFDKMKFCAMFQISKQDGKITLRHVCNINFELEPLSFSLINHKLGLLLTQNEITPTKVYRAVSSNDKVEFERETQFNLPIVKFANKINSNWNKFKESLDVTSDNNFLYKQWFDNVEVYQEKKRQRLENKKLKRLK